MAKKLVPMNPMKRSMGEDFDQETLMNLATLAQNQNQGEPLDVSGTAMPMQNATQEFEDVPRQPAERDPLSWGKWDKIPLEEQPFAWGRYGKNAEAYPEQINEEQSAQPGLWDRFVKYAENYQSPPEDELLPEDLQGLELLQQGDIPEQMPEMQGQPHMDSELPQELMQAPVGEVFDLPIGEMSPLQFIRQRVGEDPSLLELLPEETRKMLQNPDDPLSNHQLNEVQTMAIPTTGAAEAAEKDPNVNRLMKRLDGLSEDEQYPPDIIEKRKRWVDLFNSEMESLDAQEQDLLRRASNNSLDQSEIIALGLAILAPTILGMFYGKEAALGAIAGGLKGAAEYAQGKIDKSSQSGEMISKLNDRKKDYIDKDIEFQKGFEATIKDPKLRKYVQEKGYTPLEEFGTVGINVLPEMGVYLDAEKFTGDEDYDLWRKEWPSDREAFANHKEFNESLKEIEDLLEAINEQNPSFWNILASKVKGKIPKSWRDKLGEGAVPYVDVEINGEPRRVNALQQLEEVTNRFQSSYIKLMKFENKLTDNLKTHLGGIIPNPNNLFVWIEANADDLIDKAKLLRNDANRIFVESAGSKGYVRGTLEAQYPFGDYKVLGQSENLKKDVLTNPKKYADKVVR